jgi:hypothetical protein
MEEETTNSEGNTIITSYILYDHDPHHKEQFVVIVHDGLMEVRKLII